MKTAAPQLVTFFNTERKAIQFDLWTITLQSGAVVRWTDADIDIPLPDGRTFLRGPVISRGKIKWVRGIEVDQLRVVFSGPTLLVDGKALPGFAAAGGFDAAQVLMERVYLNHAMVVQGSLVWFPGIVADAYPSRMGCEIVVKSPLSQLSQQIPPDLYQPSCLNDLYDSKCTAVRASFTITGTIDHVGAAPNNPALAIALASPAPARFLELGACRFTSGANSGIGRTVQVQQLSGTLVVLLFSRPFPFSVQPGDAVTVSAGCDKTPGTCDGRFGNLLHFRGQPYVPVPETAT